jgi:hypothetical protein
LIPSVAFRARAPRKPGKGENRVPWALFGADILSARATSLLDGNQEIAPGSDALRSDAPITASKVCLAGRPKTIRRAQPT